MRTTQPLFSENCKSSPYPEKNCLLASCDILSLRTVWVTKPVGFGIVSGQNHGRLDVSLEGIHGLTKE